MVPFFFFQTHPRLWVQPHILLVYKYQQTPYLSHQRTVCPSTAADPQVKTEVEFVHELSYYVPPAMNE